MKWVRIKSPEDLGSIYRHPCILSLRVATLKEGATLGTNETTCKGHPFTKETHCKNVHMHCMILLLVLVMTGKLDSVCCSIVIGLWLCLNCLLKVPCLTQNSLVLVSVLSFVC